MSGFARPLTAPSSYNRLHVRCTRKARPWSSGRRHHGQQERLRRHARRRRHPARVRRPARSQGRLRAPHAGPSCSLRRHRRRPRPARRHRRSGRGGASCPAWSPRAPSCPCSASPSRPPRCKGSTRCSPSCRCPAAFPSPRSPSAFRGAANAGLLAVADPGHHRPRARSQKLTRLPRRPAATKSWRSRSKTSAQKRARARGFRLSNSAFPVLLPGATIGIFGGGQLGRLTAMAARTMGYRIHVLDPDPAAPRASSSTSASRPTGPTPAKPRAWPAPATWSRSRSSRSRWPA
jgi:hypothetical protein